MFSCVGGYFEKRCHHWLPFEQSRWLGVSSAKEINRQLSFCHEVVVSQIKSWGGGKQLEKWTVFFKPPPAKPLASSLQTSVPKRQKNSDTQEPGVSCVIEDLLMLMAQV